MTRRQQPHPEVVQAAAEIDWVVPPRSSSVRDLTYAHRVQRFAEAYVASGSAAEAARRAGYTPSHASRAAVNLLRRYPQIKVYAIKKRAEIVRKIELSQESVILELARLAFSSISNAVTWTDGAPRIADSDMIDDDTLAAIQEISADADGKMKLKMYDKRAALVELGKFMGMAQPGDVADLLRRLAGGEDEAANTPKMDPRELARRTALIVRKGRIALGDKNAGGDNGQERT